MHFYSGYNVLFRPAEVIELCYYSHGNCGLLLFTFYKITPCSPSSRLNILSSVRRKEEALSVRDARVARRCEFREKGADLNVISIFLRKILE